MMGSFRVPEPSGMASAQWRDSVVRQFRRLGQGIEGRLVVEPDPAQEPIPAERYLDLDYLYQAVVRAMTSGTDSLAPRRPSAPGNGDTRPLDVRIAASRFSRHYASALSAVALTGLARGVGIDVSLPRCRMISRHNVPMLVQIDVLDQEIPRCAERPTAWPAGGPPMASVDELRQYVWRRLYSEHLAPVFTRLLEIVNVTPKLLWANAAEWVGVVSDAAEKCLDAPDATSFIADRKALLNADELPGIPGKNPLRRQIDWVPTGEDGYPREAQTRRICCLTYLLDDRLGRLCHSCPFLSLEDRVALIRERHDNPEGNTIGPATQRSIDIGLAKVKRAERTR